ncbi:MAG: peptidylprolyl isomerase [Proteobacteria bacterium]|nr:peptidylprolyl isomerase [Pseudomonadota bacterium]
MSQAAASGCSVRSAITARPRKVSVNDVVIPREAIARETQNHPAPTPIEAWQAAAQALAIRELLLQEARRHNVEARPLTDADGRRETDEEALIRQIIEIEVSTPEADEAACRRYFEKNRARFRTPPLYEVSHILLPAADAETLAAAKTLAQSLIDELIRRPDRFAALARDCSACPSAANGGNLGQIGPGQTVDAFERALAGAPVGVVCPVAVESRFGVHIIRVDHCIAGRDLPFELVRDRIANWLEESVRRSAVHQYITILASRARIEGIELRSAGQ